MLSQSGQVLLRIVITCIVFVAVPPLMRAFGVMEMMGSASKFFPLAVLAAILTVLKMVFWLEGRLRRERDIYASGTYTISGNTMTQNYSTFSGGRALFYFALVYLALSAAYWKLKAEAGTGFGTAMWDMPARLAYGWW